MFKDEELKEYDEKLGEMLNGPVVPVSKEENNNEKLNSSTIEVVEIELDKIEFESPFQVRLQYDAEKIDELAQSIKNQGLIQPILVKKIEDDKYQIIAGHRRYLAFKELGRQTIPTLIKENLDILEEELITLSENLIRENLDPLEVALSFESILSGGLVKTQAQLAREIGIDKSTVSRYLKLLKLPSEIKTAVREKKYTDIVVLNKLITLNTNEALEVFEKIIKEDLNRQKALELINSYKEKNDDKNKENKNDEKHSKGNFERNGYKIVKAKDFMKIEIDPSKLPKSIKDDVILEFEKFEYLLMNE